MSNISFLDDEFVGIVLFCFCGWLSLNMCSLEDKKKCDLLMRLKYSNFFKLCLIIVSKTVGQPRRYFNHGFPCTADFQ